MPAGKFRCSGIECVPIVLIGRSHYECDQPSKNCLCDDPIRTAEEQESEQQLARVRRMSESKPITILIDMDNTLNDWDRQFRRLCAYYHPEMPPLPPEKRTHYHMELNFDEILDLKEYRDVPQELTELDGFWREMPLADGAYEAVCEMLAMRLMIFFVSKPDGRFLGRSCKEKANWIERNFGDAFKSRLILCSDKTVVHGDILVDDNPKASQGCKSDPSWTHVFYCQPYNKPSERNRNPYRIHSWRTWLHNIQPALDEVERRRRQ